MISAIMHGVTTFIHRINHVMRNAPHLPLLDVMREAHRFATSIGATDEAQHRPCSGWIAVFSFSG